MHRSHLRLIEMVVWQPPGWEMSAFLPSCFFDTGVSENSVPLNPMVLLIIIPIKNGYFIGNIPYFQTNPYIFIDVMPLFSVLVFIDAPPFLLVLQPTDRISCLHSGWSQRHKSHDTWAPFKMIFGKAFFVFLDAHMVSLLHWLTKTPHDYWQKPLPNNRYLHPDPKIEAFSDGGSENSPEVFEAESHQRAPCGIPSTSHDTSAKSARFVTAAAPAVSQRPRNGFCRMPRTANRRREQEGAQTTGKLVYNILIHFITTLSGVYSWHV